MQGLTITKVCLQALEAWAKDGLGARWVNKGFSFSDPFPSYFNISFLAQLAGSNGEHVPGLVMWFS